jgi:Ca-activated chloride channel homolog
MFAFQYPFLLATLLLLPLLWWYQYRFQKQKSPTLRLSTAQAVEQRITWRVRIYKRIHWLKYAALGTCLLALARPQIVDIARNIEGKGIDIVLALDISPSMLAKDFKPDRLAVAKRVAMRFVQSRPVDRIALVSFAGEAIVEYPLTTDHALIQSRIDGMDVGQLADGTAIGMGLGTALTRLRDTTTMSRIIILMTDGENNAGYYAPEQATDIAVTLGVRVYTIGIGTDEMAEAPIARNPDGTYEFASRRLMIDETLLKNIAARTGGKYFHAQTEDMLQEVYHSIDQLERSTYQIKEVVHRKELFHTPVLIALILLLVEAILRWYLVRAVE